MASQDVTRVSSKRLTYNGWLDSNEDPKAYADHVNPVWVKLLDTLGMNANYTRATGSELHTSNARTILDCLSGYGVHNVGHNRPFLVAELVAEL
jgi:acetylornithine/succinyldiaminopimelate/putrescine aminotransferase